MKIKNLLFQPLALHQGESGEGLHLKAREVREISPEQMSEEIGLAVERGLALIVHEEGDPAQSPTDGNEPGGSIDAQGNDAAESVATDQSAGESASSQKKGKRR